MSKYTLDGVKGDRPVGGFSPVLRVDFGSSGGPGGKTRSSHRRGIKGCEQIAHFWTNSCTISTRHIFICLCSLRVR